LTPEHLEETSAFHARCGGIHTGAHSGFMFYKLPAAGARFYGQR
jgi:hypothetical protein